MRPAPFGLERRAGGRVELEAGAVVDWREMAREPPLALPIELVRGLVTAVEQPTLAQALRRRLVAIGAVGLAHE